jgi:hypothetical protein
MAHQLQFIRAWLTLNRGEFRAILLALALLVALALIAIRSHGFFLGSNAGFAPGWECTQVPNSEPVCVKKPAAPSPDSR